MKLVLMTVLYSNDSFIFPKYYHFNMQSIKKLLVRYSEIFCIKSLKLQCVFYNFSTSQFRQILTSPSSQWLPCWMVESGILRPKLTAPGKGRHEITERERSPMLTFGLLKRFG